MKLTSGVTKVKVFPGLTEGRGSEWRPPVESITRLFLYKGNEGGEKRKRKNLATVEVSSQK